MSANATPIGLESSVACCAANASTTCWWMNAGSPCARVYDASSS